MTLLWRERTPSFAALRNSLKRFETTGEGMSVDCVHQKQHRMEEKSGACAGSEKGTRGRENETRRSPVRPEKMGGREGKN